MSISGTVNRIIAVATLAGAMARTTASAAIYRTINTHGYWESIVVELDGDTVTGAVSHIGSDFLAAILIKPDSITLRLQGRWDLDRGDLAFISIVVDGAGYQGKVRAINDRELEMEDLSREFLKAVLDAGTAVIQIGQACWTLRLHGLAPSLRDAIDFQLYLEL